MDALTSVIAALNSVANALGRILYPIGLLPGWLSATIVAVATGIAMLVMFKYTSNQRAIKQVRRGIRANLLSVKLFKDNIGVGLRAQGRVLLGAFKLLLFAVVPILIMTIPMAMLLAQLGVWYQSAPLPVWQEAVVVMKLNGEPDTPMPPVSLLQNESVEDVSGPVRVNSAREICWIIRPSQPGYHRLKFAVDSKVPVEKELAVGTGIMRVSPMRPNWNWWKVLENPLERPFNRESTVKSIAIEYPTRTSWITGADNWVIYWLVVSLIAGFCLRGVFKVNF